MRRLLVALVTVTLTAVGVPASAGPLGLRGSISGTVTDEGGVPLEGICVETSGRSSFFAQTAADGTYAFERIPAGTYHVSFTDCSSEPVYLSEWYDDQPTFDTATPVEVGRGDDVTGIDAELALGGSISGVVTSDESNTPIEGICVDAELDSVDRYASGFAQTDASGAYTVRGLPEGRYRVSFYDCFNFPEAYQYEYYNDKPDWEHADLVTVQAGQETSGIDAALASAQGGGGGSTDVDFAVTDLSVENVPLRTDAADVPSGFSRKVHATFANLTQPDCDGDVCAIPVVPAYLYVHVCPNTAGVCRSLADEAVFIAPGETNEMTLDWNGLGTVGDVTVEAGIEPAYFSFEKGYGSGVNDSNWDNNYRSVDHYVLVGGTGIGVGI